MAFAYLRREAIDVDVAVDWVQRAGVWAPVAFILACIPAAILFVPGALMEFAAGALFGPALGALYGLIGATLGATVAFTIARHLGAGVVSRFDVGWLRVLVTGVEQEGWRFVALVRLTSLLPYGLLNYLLGLTRIPLSHFAVGSFVFMLPAAIAYAYLGYLGREALEGDTQGIVYKALLAFALLGAAAFLPRLVRRIRRPTT